MISSRDEEKTLAHVLDQLANPEEFMAKVRSVYEHPVEESLDILRFKDAAQVEGQSPANAKGRVLVMDDERVVSSVATEILSNLGYRVTICEDGVTALNLYREAKESGVPYAVVFMDLTIPGGMGGKIAMEKLLEIDPDARGIVMSGYSNAPILSNYREYGFRGVVVKPFTANEIIKVMRDVEV